MNDAVHVVGALGISLAIQAVFFTFAASLRTDKVTDLSYGLTFVVLALLFLIRNDPRDPAQAAMAAMVVLWGVRLAAYLVYRIARIGRDTRFDGIREDFLKFARFWFFQGVAVWVIMLPVTAWFANPGGWRWTMAAAAAVWAAGWTIETVADIQKFRHKMRPGTGRGWTDTGLWRYSRHPNYFGELLCWWGIFAYAAPAFTGWAWLTVAGPLALTFLLLRVTGIPPLERRAEEKWGGDPAYRRYVGTTPRLVPWPFR